MKTRIFLTMLMVAALMISCQKEKEPDATTQDVSFSAIKIDPDGGLKGTEVWPCKANVPDFAKVKINDTYYYPALFTLDGQLYTQAIKLAPGTYSVQEFVLYDDVDGIEGITDGDVIVFGTPEAGSPYAVYVTPTLPFNFTVEAFKKIQVEIQVLCFQDHLYTDFGFFWFHITEIVVREQCFFGDICLKHYLDYADSDYDLQPGGLKIDMPAIMRIDAYRNGVALPVPYNTFTNDVAPNYGEGAPLCVVYPDNLSINGEIFTFDLFILVKVGTGFQFVKFHTWTFTDDQMIPAGADGVVDFVLGNCNLTDPDLQLAPYMNLPATCGLTTGGVVPSVTPIQGSFGYFDVTLSGIGAGYDISNMMYAVNCFNREVTIYLNTYYLMNVYNSLYPMLMPAAIQALPWSKANWLINHLGNFPGYAWSDVQQAIWKLEDPAWNMAAHALVPAGGSIAMDMYNAANANGAGYVPLPGGWAAVTFETVDPGIVQCVFLRIDP